MSQLRSIQPIKSGLGLRELQAVLAIAELGSFRAAAAALGFTQSALSHQVSALEAALGQSLFDRPGGRAAVRLTPAGEAVCRRARRALAEVEAVAADAEQAARGESVRVRVGVTQTAAAEIMPAALRAFRDDHPGVEVVLVAADELESSRDGLLRGDFDLAFSYNSETDEYIEAIAVVEDPMVILTRRDSAIASLDRPEFTVLDQQDLVAWARRWRGQATLEDGRARPRLHRAGGRQPGRRPGADLAGAGRGHGPADDCLVLRQAPPGDRDRPHAHHGHPLPGRVSFSAGLRAGQVWVGQVWVGQVWVGQVDEHALVREAGVVHQVPGPPPAQPAEEGDVGGLDEGLHLPA